MGTFTTANGRMNGRIMFRRPVLLFVAVLSSHVLAVPIWNGSATGSEMLPPCSMKNPSCEDAASQCCIASPSLYPVGSCCSKAQCQTKYTIAGPVGFCNTTAALDSRG